MESEEGRWGLDNKTPGVLEEEGGMNESIFLSNDMLQASDDHRSSIY